mmetsp:Transcript_1860/g.5528  ORF Transcript_1860/g.5528 Transcript_1860/m.5528 type:complete len:376 (-) Transcript_1860:329-1456(-)
MAASVATLVVRENPGQNRAVIFLAAGEEETSLSVTFADAPDERRIVSGDELAKRLLHMHGDAILGALRASASMGEFAEELSLLARDELERSSLARQSAAFFEAVLGQLGGCDPRCVRVPDPSSLERVSLLAWDHGGHAHRLNVHFPPSFPAAAPAWEHSLPWCELPPWTSSSTIAALYAAFCKSLARLQPFLEFMRDVDSQLFVIEPEHPTTRDVRRRVALGRHCSVEITIDPTNVHAMPTLEFYGANAVVAPLRSRAIANRSVWESTASSAAAAGGTTSSVARLEALLGTTLPKQSDADEADDVRGECGICYAYRITDDGPPPDAACDNPRCGKPFHVGCLREWLASLPTTRESFGALIGACPYCSHPLRLDQR